MQSIAVAIPAGASSAEDSRRIANELTSGSNESDHHNLRRNQGFSRIKVFRQHRPPEMIIVYMEAEDIEAALRAHAGEDHELQSWLHDAVHRTHGHRVESAETAPSELLFDWHAEHGVSKTGHPV